MANKGVLGEGASINRPPAFNGESYDFWKIRMRIFIEAQDLDIWNAIENGPYIPHDVIEGETIIKKREQWTPNDKVLVQADLKAKNILTSALGFDEFYRVSNCKSAKEMWDTLQITHEGTHEVKRSKLNALSQEYEMFRMQPGESVADMQKRFIHLINHLQSLGKEYSVAEQNMKVLRSLTREWQPKVTAISEKKSLSTLPLAALFGKLQEHELELSRLDRMEENDRSKGKSVALKATNHNEDTDASTTDEDISLLVRKFNNFLKKKRQRRNRFKKGEGYSKVTCFECGKPGHVKSECPDLKKKSEKKSKRPKKAYIAWEDNDSTCSSSSSDQEEHANLCLMADHEKKVHYFTDLESISASSDSDSDCSTSKPSYDELQNAFEELFNESIKLGKDNKRLKSEMKSLTLQNTELSLEVENLKNRIEVLDSLEKNVKPCENCPKLHEEIKKLNKSVEMHSSCSKSNFENNPFNLDVLLRSQRKGNDKRGLGYVSKSKGPKLSKQKNASKPVFVKAKKSPVCTYCGINGHINTRCYFKLDEVPRGRYKWVKRQSTHCTNLAGPKNAWVPP